MALSDKVRDLATRAGAELKAVRAELAGKAPSSHAHTTAEVTGLDTALAGKSPTSHSHSASSISGGKFAPLLLPHATEADVGAIKLATTAEVLAGADVLGAVTPTTLAAWGAGFGANRRRAVFIGSSNVAASPTAWPTLLGAERGWTVHNYAIGGTGYFTMPTTQRFRAQVANAVAGMTATERDEVGHFFVGDASNDARSVTAYGNMVTEARATYTAIRQNFPNARIVVLPVIWPADAQKYTPAIWQYDLRWNGAARGCAEAQREVLSEFSNVLYIDQSWTWLTGRDEYMLALQDVHPNAAGHALIARYVSRSLDGELVVPETGWVDIVAPSGYTNGHRGRWLGVKRRGWTVDIDGSMLKNAGISGFAEYGSLPYGFRPTYETSLMATPSDTGGISGNALAIHVYPSGQIRRYDAAGRLGILLTGTFEIG